MKHQNIIALCLGIFVAALLWQYYLLPKYQIKQETPELMALLEETAQKELEESINYDEPGEILFVGEQINASNQELTNAPQKEEDLVFFSQANKPKDIFDLASKDETKKRKAISIDSTDFVLDPSALDNLHTEEAIDGDASRITMLKLPSEFLVINNGADYKKFLQGKTEKYPEVNFKKERIAFVLSASKLADSFFEIVKAEITESEVKILYRVNLISASKDTAAKNYILVQNLDLPINFIQVK